VRRISETKPEQVTPARASISVDSFEPTAYDSPSDGPTLARNDIRETFSGDIEGTGVALFLQAGRPDGSASFVGMERVTGQVLGRAGTFVLQASGTVEGPLVNGDWFVVAGSGTGELAGLRGEGGFRANLGAGAEVHLDVWFEPAATATS
jgi:hypothetical protein